MALRWIGERKRSGRCLRCPRSPGGNAVCDVCRGAMRKPKRCRECFLEGHNILTCPRLNRG